MEGHPIPQDITGFQFKLIGDMTIKQFAYVAFGAVLAWIFYALPLPGIIKFPFAGFFALSGAGLAFIPVSGRPMDAMALNFIKATFSPSQYVYQKTGGQMFSNSTNAQPVARPVILNGPTQAKIEDQGAFAQTPSNNDITFPTPPHIISSNSTTEEQQEDKKENIEQEEAEKEQLLEKEEEYIEKELADAKTQESSTVNLPNGAEMHQKVLELEKLLGETAAQRQELERQILNLQQKLNNQDQNPYKPAFSVPKRETTNARSVPAGMAKSVGVPITPEFPNLLTGIVKDPRGNPLPNILVEVKDKEGNPVRAFKTNGLGQFASATTLSNGTYDIVFEDTKGQNKFDTIEISATGEIILPLEIISQDAREDLRKALFQT